MQLILKLKDNAVPAILDLAVMLQHTSVCFYYMVTIAFSVITDHLKCTEYFFLFFFI